MIGAAHHAAVHASVTTGKGFGNQGLFGGYGFPCTSPTSQHTAAAAAPTQWQSAMSSVPNQGDQWQSGVFPTEESECSGGGLTGFRGPAELADKTPSSSSRAGVPRRDNASILVSDADGNGMRPRAPRRSVSQKARPSVRIPQGMMPYVVDDVVDAFTAAASKPAPAPSRRASKQPKDESGGADKPRIRRADSKTLADSAGPTAPPQSRPVVDGMPRALPLTFDEDEVCTSGPTKVPEVMLQPFEDFRRYLQKHCERFIAEQEQAVASLLFQAMQQAKTGDGHDPQGPLKAALVQHSVNLRDGCSSSTAATRAEQDDKLAVASPDGAASEGLEPRDPWTTVRQRVAQAKNRRQTPPRRKTPNFQRKATSEFTDSAPSVRFFGEVFRRPTLSDKLSSLAGSVAMGGSILLLLSKLVAWYENIEEPKRSGRVSNFVEGHWFNIICALAIGLNAIFIVQTTDYEIDHLDEPPTPYMLWIEMMFTAFFTGEMVLKLYVHRLFLFVKGDIVWNLFDVMLVSFSAVEASLVIYVETSDAGWRKGVNVAYLRSLRIFKLAKVLRIVRSLRFFNDLRVMVDCVVGSLVSLFWCMVLLVFILYIFALLIMQGLTQAIINGDMDDEQRCAAQQLFGSVASSMFTLLKATTSGMDWGDVVDVLSGAGVWLTVVFMFYILFFCIAAWNVITASFLDRALQISRPDAEAMMLEEKMRDMCDGQAILDLFREMDVDGSERLSLEEFKKISAHPRFRSFLHARGTDINDATLFFKMLTNNGAQCELDPNTFVNACLRMKGPATSIDLHSLNFETKLLSRTQQQFSKQTLETLHQLQEQLAELTHPGFETQSGPRATE